MRTPWSARRPRRSATTSPRPWTRRDRGPCPSSPPRHTFAVHGRPPTGCCSLLAACCFAACCFAARCLPLCRLLPCRFAACLLCCFAALLLACLPALLLALLIRALSICQIDAAARVLDPLLDGAAEGAGTKYGIFFKDYKPTEW